MTNIGAEGSWQKRVRKEKKNSDVDHDDCLLRLPHLMRDFCGRPFYIPIPAAVLVMRSTTHCLGSYDDSPSEILSLPYSREVEMSVGSLGGEETYSTCS